MKILSLFDWISCGRVALDRAGIKTDKYFAAEIEKFPIQISKKNYPEIIQLGDVQRLNRGCSWYLPWVYDWRFIWKTWDDEIPNILFDCKDIDLILWWPPCQDLSIAKKNWKWLEWKKSSLFYDFVRILRWVRPKYFLMENVASMKQSEKEKIDKALAEIYPDMVCYKFNSSRVSAQNRKRYYWTNIPGVTEPDDRGILLRDILEDIPMDDPRWRVLDEKYLSDKAKLRLREKSLSITASYHKKTSKNYFEKDEWQIVLWVMQTLTTNKGEWPKISDGYYYRKLTPFECERLQTLPDNYTAGLSDSQRYKAIGNGWTVDVIAHILSFIPR